ncbi:MAG: hypothetical protein H0U32_11790 [Thermoleophilaceae bacterium]|nr:hypothetical protein [Thermoleophilaceae bacterium]
MRRTALLIGALLLLAVLAPRAAQAVPILDEADGAELAQSLAEATEEQDVCYGWEVEVQDQSGGPGGVDAGSSQGPGVALDRARCPRYAVLRGLVVYTSETAESEDGAEVAIESNLRNPPTPEDLARLGLSADDLLSETDDIALTDMAGALPLLVAEAGEARFIPFEAQTEPLAAGDVPTNTPGSDWLRTFWWLPVLAVLGVLALLFALASFVRRRRAPA